MTDPLPLPPELAAPTPDADEWLEEFADFVVEVADDAGMDPDALVHQLLDVPADAHVNDSTPGLAIARRWAVVDDGAAEWSMRHVASATAEIEKLRLQADEWEARIHAWFTQRAKPLEAKVAFMTSHLERYALYRRSVDEKAKTLTLPSGKVRTTESSPKVVLDAGNPKSTGRPESIEWAEANAPDAIQTIRKLLVSDLRHHVHPRQLVTLAWVTNSCGCKVSVRDDEGLEIPPVGTETECVECGKDALIGRVEELAHRWVAVDDNGAYVPGVDVDPGGVTAKVVPG